MSEYLLLISSAIVSRVVNLLGRFRRRVPARILVVKLDHVGDVILATPALRALRSALPDAEIDMLLAPGSAVVLEGSQNLARILYYDSRRYRRSADRQAGGEGALATLREIARGGYSTVVELRGDWWTLLLPFLAGARRRVDRGSVRIGDWLARRLPGRDRGRPSLHEVETNLEVVRPLLNGKVPESPRVEIAIRTDVRDSMLRKLREAGVDLGAPIVCIHPAATWRPRAWRAERFAAIADWIQEHYHAQVVFIGSAEERDVEAAVRAETRGPRAFWFAGALSIAEVGALLPHARLYIGNDAGPAHIAAACGIPSVVLFGPQEPRRFRPWSERSIVLHHRVPCFPCRQVVCVRPENPCVNLIELAEVEERAREILGPPESFR